MKTVTEKKVIKKEKTTWKIRILTRHPSYRPLKEQLPKMPFKSVVRFGSTTEVPDTLVKGGKTIELNSIEGVSNSASKLKMKKCFTLAGVKTAPWFIYNKEKIFINMSTITISPVEMDISKLPYPIIAKHIFGSRGTGNYKLDTQKDLENFISTRESDLEHFIFEKYMSFLLEYRLHISRNGCFYTCRKVLRKDTPKDKMWSRHSDNCNWLVFDNPEFKQPNSWDKIIEDCMKAQEVLGLDICCFDVKVQSPTDSKGNNRKFQDFILLESGSAASQATGTTEHYLSEIVKVLEQIAEEYKIIK